MKDELDRLSIPAVPKTSGSRGLHIYIPLPKKTTYETGQLLSNMIATVVSTKHPKVATIERWVKKRPRGTVYVDYLQNILGRRSRPRIRRRDGLRGRLHTAHVERSRSRRRPADFAIRTVLPRFERVGDRARLRTGKAADIRGILRKAKTGSTV